MGKAIQSLAGVAVSAIATWALGPIGPYITWGGALGAAFYVGAVFTIGAVAGKLTPTGETNFENIQSTENYAVATLRNDVNNNNVRPIIYGQARVGGNRVFSDLQSGNNNNLYEIIEFAQHECNAFINLMANNENMTQGTGSDTNKYRFANDKILIQVYTNKPITAIKAVTSYSGGVWTTADLSGLTFQNTTFNDTSIPSEACFAVVHHIYDTSDNAQRKEITAEIQGKLIRTITDSSTINSTKSYSNNCAEVVLDFLTDSKVFNAPDSKINISDFYKAKLHCANNSFSTNIGFSSAANRSAALTELLATFRGYFSYSQGIYKLKYDGILSTSFSLTGSDIISGSFSWSQNKTSSLANKLYIKYINPSDDYQTKQTDTIEDLDLIASDGREYLRPISIRGITNENQANILRDIAFNMYRYTEDNLGNRIKVTPLTVKLSTTIKNSTLEVGDIGTIDYEELPTIKKFKIISVKTKMSGQLDLVLQEYSDTHFKNSSNNYIIV